MDKNIENFGSELYDLIAKYIGKIDEEDMLKVMDYHKQTIIKVTLEAIEQLEKESD